METIRDKFLKLEDIKILKSENKYSGFCSVVLHTLQNRLFNGKMSNVYTREVVNRHDAVCILPYDPKNDCVVLIEQLRVAIIKHISSEQETPWLIELVAGIIDKDETHQELIKREMIEEAGLEALNSIKVCEYFVSPGISSEKVTIYCVKVDSDKMQNFCGLERENEDIKTYKIKSKLVIEALNNGEFINSSLIIAIQWFEKNIENLKKKWK